MPPPVLAEDTELTSGRAATRAVLAAVRASGARRVGDLGCGEGALLSDLLAERDIEHVVATDVSVRSLEIAARRLRLDTMPDAKRARISLIQSLADLPRRAAGRARRRRADGGRSSTSTRPGCPRWSDCVFGAARAAAR